MEEREWRHPGKVRSVTCDRLTHSSLSGVLEKRALNGYHLLLRTERYD